MGQANIEAPAPLANMGEPIRRLDGVAKVTGKLAYAADTAGTVPFQAYFLTSGIARGRILSIDTAPAEALDGIVKVYTHHNAPHRIATPYTQKGGYASDTNMPLTGPEIHHDGQIIAMVVAETYEVARDASHRITVRYPAPSTCVIRRLASCATNMRVSRPTTTRRSSWPSTRGAEEALADPFLISVILVRFAWRQKAAWDG